jgi:GWxTD domain-containing protein
MPGWKTDRGHVFIVYGPPRLDNQALVHRNEPCGGTVELSTHARSRRRCVVAVH